MTQKRKRMKKALLRKLSSRIDWTKARIEAVYFRRLEDERTAFRFREAA